MAKKTIEEQQKRIMPISAFELIQAKVTKDGVDVKHHEGGLDAGEVLKKGEVQPHPDLLDAFAKLNYYMAARLGLLTGWDFAREHLKKNPEALKDAVAKHDETVGFAKAGGIILVGSGETYGVSITGSLSVPGKGSTGLTVPKITFGKATLGYENDVEEIVEEIKSEVYKYRFQGKKLQTAITDADQQLPL